MNRIKVWVYVLAVAAAAYVLLRLHTQQLRADAVGDVDARLAAASGHVLASTRAVAREASAIAALAARDARLLAALQAAEAATPAPPPRRGKKATPAPRPADPEARETAVREAARAALEAAERTLGFDLPAGAAINATTKEVLALRGRAGGAEGEVASVLRAAVSGRPQRGYVRLNGAVFFAAGAPVGDGGGVVVLAPVDDAWVKGLAAATGALLTLSVPEAKPVSTAGSGARIFSGWKSGAGIPVDVGSLEKSAFALGPLKLPALPMPLGAAPAFRARAVQLEGMKGGFLVAAVPCAPALEAIARIHWETVLGIALLVVVGAVTGLFVRSAEAPAALPAALLDAAARIERGDFAARVPPLAGKLGTLAAALNRAAELAGPAAAAETARPSEGDEPLTGASAAHELFGGALAAVPPAPPAAAVPAPQLLQAAARAAPAPASAAGADEETHFKQVFQDFLRTRATCGEPSEGLTYDKFRLKLDGNKAALVAKYGCKTVRFQVYVKDGKAALKATPVK